MSQKLKTAKGDGTIKKVDFKAGQYREKTLVNLICTDAQKKEYAPKGKFPNAKKHDAFLNRLGRYCKFEQVQNTDKINVKEVFPCPISDAEIKIHERIYQYLTPLILNQVLNDSESRWTLFNVFELAKACHLFNLNYNTMKYNQGAVEKDLQIPRYTASDFFLKVDDRINYRIRKCLDYLHSMNCITYDEVHIIQTYEVEILSDENKRKEIRKMNKPHRATKSEMNLYTSLDKAASRFAEVRNQSDKFYGNIGLRYKAELARLFKEHHIKYVCRGFEIWQIDDDRCREVFESFKNNPVSYYQEKIGTEFKNLVDSNADTRFRSREHIVNNYLDNFKELSEITLPYDSPDIRPRLPSAKKHSDILIEESQNIDYEIEEVEDY